MPEWKLPKIGTGSFTFVARLLFFSPLTGALIGSIVAHVAFNSGWILGYSYYYSDFGFTSSFGLPFGLLFGGLCGLIAYWPLRHTPLLPTMIYLAGGTLGLAIPLALIPEAGVPLSWFGSVIGFWIGFLLLLCSPHFRSGTRTDDRLESTVNELQLQSRQFSVRIRPPSAKNAIEVAHRQTRDLSELHLWALESDYSTFYPKAQAYDRASRLFLDLYMRVSAQGTSGLIAVSPTRKKLTAALTSFAEPRGLELLRAGHSVVVPLGSSPFEWKALDALRRTLQEHQYWIFATYSNVPDFKKLAPRYDCFPYDTYLSGDEAESAVAISAFYGEVQRHALYCRHSAELIAALEAIVQDDSYEFSEPQEFLKELYKLGEKT